MGKGLRAWIVTAALGAVLGWAGKCLGQAEVPQANPPAYTTVPADAQPPAPAVNPAPQPIGALVQRTGGSLLRAEMANQFDTLNLTPQTVSYFSVPEPKPKLLKKHDLVTIVVRENSAFSSNGTTDLKHGSDLDSIVDSYVTFGLTNGPALNEHSPNTPIELKTSSQRDFKGDAAVNRTDTFTARLTAEVIDVKPNGTLVLQAKENIKTDEEEQEISLVGTCRVEDVTADNTVLSNQLFNLSLNKSHKGAVKDTTERGFIPRLLDSLNPF